MCQNFSAISYGHQVSVELRGYLMSVLVPIAHGCEDLAFVIITDILARASSKVSVASIEPPGELVRLMKGVRVEPDVPLSAVAGETWQAIVIPGGIPGAMRLGESTLLRTVLTKHQQGGGLLAAICLAPTVVLEPAGLLKKCLRVTGKPLPIQTPDVRYQADEFTTRLGSKLILRTGW